MAEQNMTPSFGKVDLSQDPNDFAKILGVAKEDPQTPPAGNAAADPQGHPQDNASLNADDKNKTGTKDETKPDAKTLSTTEVAKVEPIAVTPPTNEINLSVDEKRHRDASKTIQSLSDERKRLLTVNVNLAKKNPDTLSDLALYDRKLADEVVKEAFGLGSVDEFLETQRLAKLREENPELAATEERLARERHDATNETMILREQLLKSFLQSKGVSANQFDPANISFTQALESLNPELIKKDYTGALEKAYILAGLNYTPSLDSEEAKKQALINRALSDTGAGGNGIVTPNTPSQKTFSGQAENFAALVGAKLTS